MPNVRGQLLVGDGGEASDFAAPLTNCDFPTARTPAWLELQAALQSPDSLIVLPGEDESRMPQADSPNTWVCYGPCSGPSVSRAG